MLKKLLIQVLGTGAVVLSSQPIIAACNSCKDLEPPSCRDCSGDKDNDDSDKSMVGVNADVARAVMIARQNLVPTLNKFSDKARCYVAPYTNKFKCNVNYLRNRAPEPVKIGAIVAGGVVGTLFAFRRGLIRKLLYGSFGAVTMAYLAYPKQTKEYLKQAKKCVAGTYTFAVGLTNSKGCVPPPPGYKDNKKDKDCKCGCGPN